MRIVFHGIGSEYPFHELASRARREGHDVLEVDMYSHDWRARLEEFRLEGPFNLVTSHHAYMDRHRHLMEFGVDVDIDSTPELIRKFQPRKIFYVPHDVTEPIKDEELWFIKNFDAVLAPNASWWWLSDLSEIIDVGSIKIYENSISCVHDITFFPSEISFYIRAGWECFLGKFGGVIHLKPRIKFPKFPGIKDFEDRLREIGCEVIDSTLNSFPLISNSKIIISNGLSSVLSEASSAEVPSVCVMDGVHPPATQLALFENHPFVRLARTEQAAHIATSMLTNECCRPRNPLNCPFDFDLALEVITR